MNPELRFAWNGDRSIRGNILQAMRVLCDLLREAHADHR
jgi:hypothetical protein